HEGAGGRPGAPAGALPDPAARGGGADPRGLPVPPCGGGGVRRDRLHRLLEDVAAGRVAPEAALERLAWAPVEGVVGEEGVDLPFARLDHHRALRQGYPEVVFGSGKTEAQLVDICRRLAARGDGFLVTRAAPDARAELARVFPEAEVNDVARTVYLAPAEPVAHPVLGPVLVVSAGTADLPVAEEAAVSARALGNPVERLYDVGVAGIHRILRASDTLSRAAVVIVVAGMEGALASVVGGLVGT